MHYTNGLDKQAFLDYMYQEFPSVFREPFARQMLENIVDYGTADNFTHTKNALYYFLMDMVPEVEPKDLIPFMDKALLTNEVLSLVEEKPLCDFNFTPGYYEWNLTFVDEVIWTLDDGDGSVTEALGNADIDALHEYVDSCVEAAKAAVEEADVYEFDDDDYQIIKDKMAEAFRAHFGIEDKSVDALIADATVASDKTSRVDGAIDKELRKE